MIASIPLRESLLGELADYSNPLNKGLVLHLKMNEGSGSEIYDSSQYKNNGTLNGPRWSSGRLGRALDFVTDDYISAPSIDLDHITIAVWAKVNAGGGFLVNKNYDGVNVPYSLAAEGHPQFTAGMAFFDGTWRKTGVNRDTRGDGQVHHFVGTYDGETLKYFVDAVLDSSLPYVGILPKNDSPVDVGRYLNDVDYLDGQVFSLRIYNRALSANEINRLYLLGDYSDRFPLGFIAPLAAASFIFDNRAAMRPLLVR